MRTEAPHPARFAGAAVGFAGVALVVAARGLDLGGTGLGDLLTLGAAVCWGSYLALSAPLLARLSPLRLTTWAILAGTAVLALPGSRPAGRRRDARGSRRTRSRPSPTRGSSPAGLANVLIFRAIALVGRQPRRQPPAARAGPHRAPRRRRPRRADPRRAGRGRRRDRRRASSSPAAPRSGPPPGGAPLPGARPRCSRPDAPMARAPLVPVFPPGAPVSVLVDYDGTVSRHDIGDVLLAAARAGRTRRSSPPRTPTTTRAGPARAS